MTPKFICLTRRTVGLGMMTDVWVNPRRVNRFYEAPRYSTTPSNYEGTVVDFGRGEHLYVCETPEQIRRLLK